MRGARIDVEGLRFRRPAGFELRIPRWRVEPGRRLALRGPSGSGKSTLLELLSGLLLPERGRIEVGEVRLDRIHEPERRRFRFERIGQVFQDFHLIEHLTVEESLLLRWSLGARRQLPSRRRALRELAERLAVADLLGRRPGALSQGERQRFAICQALVAEPALILADEPTANLDADSAGRAVELTFDEARRLGATLLFVTHDATHLGRFDDVVEVESWGRSGP